MQNLTRATLGTSPIAEIDGATKNVAVDGERENCASQQSVLSLATELSYRERPSSADPYLQVDDIERIGVIGYAGKDILW